MSTTDKKVRKKRRWGKIFEYTSYERPLLVGEAYKELLDELEEDYSKRKNLVVTPQEISAKRDIRVSVAKQLLADLEEKKVLKKAVSNRRTQVYVKA
ncbi:MAG: hypothetical protein ACFE8U_13050 [Candidatus Hermodarchaeota archaeon]